MSKLPLINVNSFKFIVIIPAAGSSERLNNNAKYCSSSSNGPMNCHNNSNNNNIAKFSSSSSSKKSEPPKQYAVICNKPLIFHTVTSFLKLKWIDQIIVLSPPDSLTKMKEILASLAKQQQKRLNCIAGSVTRHRSIKCALDFLEKKRLFADFLIVHDGARPYVDEDVLKQLVTECYQHGVAGVICQPTSTILKPKMETLTLDHVLDRSQYVNSETPQAFRFNLLMDAYHKCTEFDLDHNTECLDLVKRYTKFDAKLIPVDPSLYFKVTYRKDLYAADNILKEQRNILLHCHFDCVKPIYNYKFIKELKDNLVSSFANVKYFSDSLKLKNLIQHSPGTVHVLLHYCDQWNIVLEQNLAAYENLVYIVINNDLENEELTDGASSCLLKWSKSVKSKDIKNFYLIFSHVKNLDQESLRIRNTVVYLSKELPIELSGQTFFI